MNKCYSIYFSPTGGTKRVVEYFSKKDSIVIDLTKDVKQITLDSTDVAFIGCPSYSGRVSHYATEKLKLIKGTNTPCVLISSFGNRASEDVLVELEDIVTPNGFNVVAGMELVTRHSIFRNVAIDRPDEKDLSEYANFKFLIDKKLITKETVKMPGNRPYKPYKLMGAHPITLDTCIKCGYCASVCPAGAISKDNPAIIDPDKCIRCMRCTVVCPVGAKCLDKEVYKQMDERLKEKFASRKENRLYI